MAKPDQQPDEPAGLGAVMSLDGYVEGPGGNVMALPMDGLWTDTTTIVRRADAHEAVVELRRRPGT